MQILVFTLCLSRPFLSKKKNPIEPKDIRTKFEYFNCSRYTDFTLYGRNHAHLFYFILIYLLLLDCLFLPKIFIFKLKLLIQKLET